MKSSEIVGFLRFECSGMNISGVKLERLNMVGDTSQPYKGIKYVVKTHSYEIRF